MKTLRKLRATLDPSSIRTETFEGREHLVVPLIALAGDAVIEAMGSDGPELVPAEELAKFPLGWNGRPATNDHPEGSANFPLTIERQAVGYIFNAAFTDNKLKMEAWIDTNKAESLGGTAARTLERLRSAEVVEVSVGASVELERVAGTTTEGKSFIGRWTNIVPDHVALLPEGAIGAFSVEMGGGTRTAMRAAKGVLRTLFTDKGKSDQDIKDTLNSLISRLKTNEFAEDMNSLGVEFWGVELVFQESQTAISMIWDGDRVRMFRHKYNDKDGTLALQGKPEEVVLASDTKFQTLSNDNLPEGATPVSDALKEKVNKLIAAEGNSFTEDNREWLEGQPEAVIDSFSKVYEGPEEMVASDSGELENVVNEPTATTEDPEGVMVTPEFLDKATEAIAYVETLRSKERSEAVKALMGKVSFTKEQLGAMNLSVLKVLAADMEKLENKKADNEGKDDNPTTLQSPFANYSFQTAAHKGNDEGLSGFKDAPNPYAKRQASQEVN